jgi:hypothetical protein
VIPLGDRIARGEARRMYRGPRTVAQVLEDAAAEMDLEDAEAGDPLAWVRARRQRRRTLLNRLRSGRFR